MRMLESASVYEWGAARRCGDIFGALTVILWVPVCVSLEVGNSSEIYVLQVGQMSRTSQPLTTGRPNRLSSRFSDGATTSLSPKRVSDSSYTSHLTTPVGHQTVTQSSRWTTSSFIVL